MRADQKAADRIAEHRLRGGVAVVDPQQRYCGARNDLEGVLSAAVASSSARSAARSTSSSASLSARCCASKWRKVFGSTVGINSKPSRCSRQSSR